MALNLPAMGAARAAIRQVGRHRQQAIIARHGTDLIRLARQHNAHIAFGASVAGGIPVISGLQEGLAGDELVQLCGILNGTCNYILTRIESAGVSFADALKEAQKLGFAEADPTEDVDGLDARAKLTILARTALRVAVTPSDICAGSISRPRAGGLRLRQAARLHYPPDFARRENRRQTFRLGAANAGASRFPAGRRRRRAESGDVHRKIRWGNRIRRTRRGRQSHCRRSGFRLDCDSALAPEQRRGVARRRAADICP